MELENYIRGKWYTVNQNTETIYTLQDYYKFPLDLLKTSKEEIEKSVEMGIIQYKKHWFSNLFQFLENLKYDSKGLEELEILEKKTNIIAYMSFIQKFLCNGTIRERKSIHQEEIEDNSEVDIKMVISEVQKKIKEDPQVQSNSHIKNILMQISMYKKEIEEMKRIAPNIKKDKYESFANNYKNIFHEINKKINDSYIKYVTESDPSFKDNIKKHNLWMYEIKPLLPLYTKHTEFFSLISSTIGYAQETGFKKREILLKILNKKDSFNKLMGNELAQFKTLDNSENGYRNVAREFTSEIIRIFDRHINDYYL